MRIGSSFNEYGMKRNIRSTRFRLISERKKLYKAQSDTLHCEL